MLFRNTWKMYEMINKQKEVEFGRLMSLIGWSKKKTRRHLERLVDDKIVKVNDENKTYYPTPVKELVNWEEFNK